MNIQKSDSQRKVSLAKKRHLGLLRIFSRELTLSEVMVLMMVQVTYSCLDILTTILYCFKYSTRFFFTISRCITSYHNFFFFSYLLNTIFVQSCLVYVLKMDNHDRLGFQVRGDPSNGCMPPPPPCIQYD